MKWLQAWNKRGTNGIQHQLLENLTKYYLCFPVELNRAGKSNLNHCMIYPHRITRAILVVVMLLFMIGYDQVSKQMVRKRITPNEQITVIRNVMMLTRVENTGAFLSMGDQLPRPLYHILMVLLPLLVLGYLVYYLLWHERLSISLFVGYCLIAGGGFGNIIDRIVHGSVTDFMYFNFGLFHTGIVNFADIFITAGFAVLLIEVIFVKKQSSTQ